MPRRGRSPSPSRGSYPARAAPARAAPTQPAVHQPPPSQPAMAQPQQPSLFKQMAATAGGVAVGSAVGHAVGHALVGGFGGGDRQPAEQQAAAPVQQYQQPAQQTGPCSWEIKQFLQCAESQSDLSLCSGFNEAIRACKEANGVAM
ncbi:unnamed protein product [Bemisia tabaci]|uniref:CHCH domain-containing protein n=1 Tax=Bemisia tabaci TaxID=7038 RepID=A0A9P0CAC3_BEMTA|nr:PREDICTED: coiled-coil-helix-coiled-coil-helix domain-containing protein 2-like [Bemisia tabaci]CAH0776699.1 unnamed protein product [Bemisia tabaci]